MKALLFSGQGAQKVGMGKSLYENVPIARELYDQAENTLGFEFKKICFEGPENTLTETRFCQPALYVQGFAIARILRECGHLDGLKAALGLSLGELTAYAIAGVWDFETGLRIVAERGRLMQQACDATKGGMAAVVGGTIEEAGKLCAAFDIDVANLNCPGQTVISGDYDKVAAAAAAAGAKNHGSFKLVKQLVVAGAYHSRLMEPARKAFEQFLAPIEFKTPKLTVFTNTTGQAISEPAALKEALVKQVVSTVRWEDCLRGAFALGCTDFYECGPGAVLSGMMKRTEPAARVTAINEYGELPT
ncbi:MAG: ACP S-malonyltransferase [Puniceicoccales bacterium]|jgi:[acyl-carrier-protein] S-malonyltransferase|nr:ACP S-malonyltransferase [Puniceicoccales bacterium]